MHATQKFELKKHLYEKRGQLLKKMSKYQNTKTLKQPITVALNGEVELALLLTGSKKSWLFFIFSLRHFVDHDLNS